MSDQPNGRLETDKLTEKYTLRIPECLKNDLSKLSKTQVRAMNERIFVLMARFIHDSTFDPSIYLNSDYINGNKD